ncbi:MAG: DUF4111 domain-containing protein [Clostridia bacterium]|nr:DUF4111 domain-containing protein [Clostridia bacterium]
MGLNTAIERMTARIAGILSTNAPSVYVYGSYVLADFRLGWSDIDILVLTEKPIAQQQADELVSLRQTMTADEPLNPFYRCFEGGMLTLDAFVRRVPTRVVYWGTSGQRITDSYSFDACCMKELLDCGRHLHGKDVRGQLAPPSYEDIRASIQSHYDAIRRYASHSGRSIYSFGWILDIARCVYTLRTGQIISKTAAGEWALSCRLFGDDAALRTALAVRREPQAYHANAALQDLAEELGEVIQRYADVLEAELTAAPISAGYPRA